MTEGMIVNWLSPDRRDHDSLLSFFGVGIGCGATARAYAMLQSTAHIGGGLARPLSTIAFYKDYLSTIVSEIKEEAPLCAGLQVSLNTVRRVYRLCRNKLSTNRLRRAQICSPHSPFCALQSLPRCSILQDRLQIELDLIWLQHMSNSSRSHANHRLARSRMKPDPKKCRLAH